MPNSMVTCPVCRKRSRVFLIGKAVTCPKCGASISIGDPAPDGSRGDSSPVGDRLSVEPSGLAVSVHRISDGVRETLKADFDALLGAVALHLCDRDEGASAKLLRGLMWMPDSRSRDAVRAGGGLFVFLGDTVLGCLAGIELNDDAVRFLWDLVGGEPAEEALHRRGLSLQNVTKNAAMALGRAIEVVYTDDFPTRAVGVALIESALASVAPLGQHLCVTSPHDPDKDAALADRLLAAIYALRTARLGGLPIADDLWNGAGADWCLRASPWILPLINPNNNTALVNVLDAMVEHRLDFVAPGTNPFARDVQSEQVLEWVEEVRNKAASVSHELTRIRDWPIFFDGVSANIQVLVSEDEDLVVAWVGRDNSGMLVAFDRDEFVPYGLGEPGVGVALGCAISWFVDCTISLRKASLRRSTGPHPSGKGSVLVRYWPTPTFDSDRRKVAAGTITPPRPSVVAAHVRRLGSGYPSRKQLEQAPKRLLRRMGPHDTWVRRHTRGGGTPPKDIVNRLSKYSALADSLGLLDQRLG